EQAPPERTARAAAGEAHRFYRHAELFDDVEAVLLAVRNALDERTDEVGASVARGQPDPAAASGGIEVRGSLAHQVRQPEGPARSWRGGGGGGSEIVVSIPGAHIWLRN